MKEALSVLMSYNEVLGGVMHRSILRVTPFVSTLGARIENEGLELLVNPEWLKTAPLSNQVMELIYLANHFVLGHLSSQVSEVEAKKEVDKLIPQWAKGIGVKVDVNIWSTKVSFSEREEIRSYLLKEVLKEVKGSVPHVNLKESSSWRPSHSPLLASDIFSLTPEKALVLKQMIEGENNTLNLRVLKELVDQVVSHPRAKENSQDVFDFLKLIPPPLIVTALKTLCRSREDKTFWGELLEAKTESGAFKWDQMRSELIHLHNARSEFYGLQK